jgi:hypothetical protein
VRRDQVELVTLLCLFEDALFGLLVLQLRLDGEVLLPEDVVCRAGEGATGHVDELAGEGPYLGSPEPELLDQP